LKVQFLEPAKAELKEAVRYYNHQREGLGLEFAAEVRKATQRIAKLPKASPPISGGARRFLLRRFPYGIILSGRRQNGAYCCCNASSARSCSLAGTAEVTRLSWLGSAPASRSSFQSRLALKGTVVGRLLWFMWFVQLRVATQSRVEYTRQQGVGHDNDVSHTSAGV